MFAHIFKYLKSLPLEKKDLNQVVSVHEQDGSIATLGEVLSQNASPVVLESFGYHQMPQISKIKAVKDLTEEEKEKITISYLTNIPSNHVLEIVGEGTFDIIALRKAVQEKNSVGRRFMQLVLQDCHFLEQAAKTGKITRKDDNVIHNIVIPNISFR